jgi:spermidine synthase
VAIQNESSANTQSNGSSKDHRPLLRLLLVSVIALYLEIVLIRWLGTEVRIFAYFQNLALIVCFLGFGVGCLTSKKRGSLLSSLTAITALVLIVSLPFTPWQHFLTSLSSVLSYSADAALWGGLYQRISPSIYHVALFASLLTVAVFLFLVTIAMIPLGRWVGYYLESIPDTITAYSVNLLGSVTGIWLLAILAFLWLSPLYWFTVAFALVLLLEPVSWRTYIPAFALLTITLLALGRANGGSVYWSPYQKLSVSDRGNQQYVIDVNNVGYMSIANLSDQYLSKNPELKESYKSSSYDSPFRFASSTSRVLVVGAGAGNDVAAALRHGASHVDAVEIDPLISNLGLRLHPEHPYSSPKVRLITNDARNFLRQNHSKYDVIVFGLLDSHTEFSGYSNMRVDNYVYTEQSFLDAQKLLSDDGILVLKFYVRRPWTWMGQRFFTMLGTIFPHPPLTYSAPQVGALFSATVFVESNNSAFWSKSLVPPESTFLAENQPDFPLNFNNAPPPTTDDWPYIYNRGHFIPLAYFFVSALLLGMASCIAGPLVKPRKSSTWQFFLLGAGFLLMETQLVSRLALYFGTTWLVNCVALTGILAVLLLANVYVRYRRPDNLLIYFCCLCAALLSIYLIPFAQFQSSGIGIGILLCLSYCVPLFFAGIIFTEIFRRSTSRGEAFGSNMLGAVAGGIAQNLSFVFGMKALLLIAALIYGGAALLQLVLPIDALRNQTLTSSHKT